jgi:hypothetical protein
MRAHEPGCLLYSLLKSRAKPGAYIVHEQYRDFSKSGGLPTRCYDKKETPEFVYICPTVSIPRTSRPCFRTRAVKSAPDCHFNNFFSCHQTAQKL